MVMKYPHPAANTWQVSMQTPTRDLSLICSMIEARSEKVEPRTEPDPAIVSNTGITDLVEEIARLSEVEIRVRAEARVAVAPVQPGLLNI